ncbi:tetratricopeptide repeat protein [Meiothermus sp.]|uniref:tetratricopeptide repeat protein n=1 Tax=Meiothermus sp. TaxID=1955249 RepID=UPI0021DB8889|nr:tetratricopeptide repeat protein [Meiothermus sp.]GIW24907.1 MAG: hypothetical protein KatS3mg069_1174 [Meiothermus sp.]
MAVRLSGEVWLSLEGLLLHQHIEAATKLLQEGFEACQTYSQIQQFVQHLQHFRPYLGLHPGLERVYVQALCRARQPEGILEWFEQREPDPALRVYLAWALVRQQQYEAALQLLETAQPHTDLDHSIYFRSKGEALFWLNRPEWPQVLEQARPYLRGAALGRMLLDKGWFFDHQGQKGAARSSWAEALAYLENDPYYLAWAHNSLGLVLLHQDPPKAEHHLLEALRISKKEAARAFHAQALSSLALLRRSLGEWERALHLYQQALKAASEPDDKQRALWGLGHTLRLMGRVEEALAKLLQAQEINPQVAWLEADLAAARLMLGETESAAHTLPRLQAYWQAGQLGERGQVVLRVLEAELLRREGHIPQALAVLKNLSQQDYWIREELGCFPELARMVGLEPQQQAFRVEVKPFGKLEVRVNGRRVPLPAVSKAGELLVFLLVNGRQASTELLLDRLASRGKNPRKALWQNIEKLRQTLGWQQSVQNQGGVYTLDPRAEWLCDLEVKHSPFPADDPAHTFMPGYYSDWIEEWRQQWLVV